MWLKSKIYILILFYFVEIESLVKWDKLLERIKHEVHFESILVLQNTRERCWTDLHSSSAIFNFNDRQKFQLKSNFNKRILALVCLNGKRDRKLRQTLYENIQDMRDTSTVFLVNSNVYLSDLFQECRSHMMLNVLALRISEENQTSQHIYSYRAFPRFQLVKRRLSEVRNFFEPQVKNLYGYTIIAMPDNVSPRAVIYMDAMGQRQVIGYLAYLFSSFAKSLNASLQYCCLMQKEIYNDETLSKLMENGSVDLSISLTSPSFDRFEIKNSKTVEISKWFVMIPVEPVVQRSKLYFTWNGFPYLFVASIFLALLLCNAQRLESGQRPTLRIFNYLLDEVLRGMLSQSFILPSHLSAKRLFIYWLLLFSGLLLCNIYLARLDTFFIHPPTSKRIQNYEDFRSANLKIFIARHDYELLEETIDESILKQNSDIFIITDSAIYFQKLRNELNTTYAYSVTSTLWPLLVLKQAKLERPIFRDSNEITFLSHLLLSLPLPRNSIFENAINRFVSLTHSSGLYTHWLQRTFDELIFIGKMSYHRSEENQSYRDLNCDDLLWFWLFYAIGTALSIIAFIIECLLLKGQPQQGHLL